MNNASVIRHPDIRASFVHLFVNSKNDKVHLSGEGCDILLQAFESGLRASGLLM
jgi:hypothetical protein